MGFYRKKNRIVGIAAAVLILAVVFAYGAGSEAGVRTVGNEGKGAAAWKKVTEEYGGVLRFHVIANSDSEYDQRVKLRVRDQVLKVVQEELLGETMLRHEGKDGDTAKLCLEEARELIETRLDVIEDAAKKVLAEEGASYGASAKLGVCFIPQKTYGDVTFPAGNYEALNITLGEGEGRNWWCVLFPPLCLIDPDGSELDGLETDPIAGGGQTITLRFKTKELYEAWR